MMKIHQIKIKELTPYEQNNKIHTEQAVEELAVSITKFGWTQPICVDEDKVILAGHRRFLAAKSLGLETVPVVIKEGISEVDARAYRLADNKLSADPNWDFENIDLEMFYLKDKDIDIHQLALDEFLKDESEIAKEEPKKDGDVGFSITYNIVFENELQQKEWFKFVRFLKGKYAGLTLGEALSIFVGEELGEAV